VQASHKTAQLQLLLNLRGSKQTQAPAPAAAPPAAAAPAAAARVQGSVAVQLYLVTQHGLAQTSQHGIQQEALNDEANRL
jgi:3-oxoacyl-ACP reductase-like protein